MLRESAAQPLVSVVVPNWNGAGLVGRCLRAIGRQELRSFETIVVDGASTDESVALVRSLAPEARILELAENLGFAAAANAGALLARGRYLAFLNSDAEPGPRWLKLLLACLERHPRAASASPKILLRDAPEMIDGAGDAITWSLKAYRRGAGEPDRGQYDREEPVFAASGTAALWRAEAFHELGGFDESFFAYYEDVDLGFRARLAGWESWYEPGAVVLHRGAASSAAAASVFESFHAVQNRWSMIVKTTPRGWLLRRAHVVALGEGLSLGRSLLHGSGALHFRAYLSVARSLPRLLGERRALRPSRAPGRPELYATVGRSLPPLRSTLARRRDPAPARQARRGVTPGTGEEAVHAG